MTGVGLSVCPVCGLTNERKLQCPERPNPQMQVNVRQGEHGWEAIGSPWPVGADEPEGTPWGRSD